MKRIILTVLAIALIFALSFSAVAANLLTYGDWTVTFGAGEGVTFIVDSCSSSDAELTVPNSFDGVRIVGVGDHAFLDNTTAEKISMGAYVSRIGAHAFSGCTALTTVTLTPAVTELAENAFSGAPLLSTINLEDSSVTVLRSQTFLNAPIERIALPETCISIQDNAFAQCAQLERILIPAGVTEIGELAFRGCGDFVIYCYSGSFAHEFAEARGISYVLLDVPVDVTVMLGDADGDGKITILDATKIQRLLASLVTDADGMIALRGDADSNGIDILDATRIQRWLAGFTVSEQIGTDVVRGVLPVFEV